MSDMKIISKVIQICMWSKYTDHFDPNIITHFMEI
jgi:hypothetical protein